MSPQSPSNTDLQAFVKPANVDRFASIVSLTCTPNDHAISKTPIDSPREAPEVMDTPHENAFSDSSGSTGGPPPDLHSKAAGETQRFSRTAGMRGLASAMQAAKKLQQIVGDREPTPFVTPPEVPEDLEDEFMEGLEEYGLDTRLQTMDLETEEEEEEIELSDSMSMDALSQAPDISDGMGLDALCQAAALQDRLPDIVEEGKSRAKAAFLSAESQSQRDNSGATLGMHTFTREDDSMRGYDGAGQEAAAQSMDQRRTLAVNHKASVANVEDDFDTVLRDAGMGQDFDSSTTLADSVASRPGSSTSTISFQVPSMPYTASGLDFVRSFARSLDYGETGGAGAGYELRPQSSSFFAPLEMTLDTTPAVISKQLPNYGTHHGYGSALQQSPTQAPLFPSPRIGAQIWDYTDDASQRSAPTQDATEVPHSSSNQIFEDLFREPPPLNVPQIQVQMPSPTKVSSSKKRSSRKRPSKKRAPSNSGEDLLGPALKDARAEDNTSGLPILPADAEALWKSDFPGNTHALLMILLKWSFAMQSLYNQLPDAKTFRLHGAFPFSVDPPVYKRLISASFYDTSVTPHKEIRFLGPGDAAELVYAEVDVFRSNEVLTLSQEQQKQTSKYETLKQKLTFTGQNKKSSRHTDQAHHAMTGEGRWAYVLVKGHNDSETAPHMLLAWHTSAVTDTSDCLHTLFPDGHTPPAPPPPSSKPPLKRYASLQGLVRPGCYHRRLHQNLRSASSSQLPQVDEVCDISLPEGARTLSRTVLKFEKAGNMPLIEGYRVDVGKFRGWMDAVGRGQGKVMLWKERESWCLGS